MKPNSVRKSIFLFVLILSISHDLFSQKQEIVNDVTLLNPVQVNGIVTPVTEEQIIEAVKSNPGPVSIGGGRYSMGGQTASTGAVQIDMRSYNKVISFNKVNKEIIVQSGITWRQLQEYIDPHDVSVLIKQTYSNFTVGGSLSVNVHGRYMGLGPIILSVKSFRIVLADGRCVTASRELNSEIFFGAIGGYGALGVITEVTLALTENDKVERTSIVMPVKDYKNWFFKNIRSDSNVVFHNADIHPGDFQTLRAVNYIKTNKNVTEAARLVPADNSYWFERMAYWMMTEMPFKHWIRENILEPWFFSGERIVWRNFEASYDVKELEPSSRVSSTYVLQEYFIPVDSFDVFLPKMAEIFQRHEVNVVNVSIRHAIKDPGSLLAWARQEVFAFVVYYKQGTTESEKNEVAVWTRELISQAISCGGRYYLPYQIHATEQQFKASYPDFNQFFELKKKLDPTNKFRNKLWDEYYNAKKDSVGADTLSRIKRVMASKEGSDGIYRFLQNVYGLYPAKDYHYLIKTVSEKYKTDQEVYENIQKRLLEITPSFWAFRYALPALSVQKKEIAAQTKQLLPQTENINGYLEIGTTGRYVNVLEKHFTFKGPVYLSYYERPSYGPQDIAERGQLSKIGTFFDLKNYDPIPSSIVPDESLDLITIYIGLHHCPKNKLDEYVKSLWRCLRPNGKLIIRDHNVRGKDFGNFVTVVHDIFYCGLGETWEYTNGEIRNFTATDSLVHYLQARGFIASGDGLLQTNDPSLNTLKAFTKSQAKSVSQEIEIKLGRQSGYRRDEAQTFLTVPEWYLVYSPAEYAAYIAKNDPSGFPYFGSVSQFWNYYGEVIDLSKDYPFNWGYHLMICVIGTSFTLENYIKGIWENTLGRLSEFFSDGQKTEEELLAIKTATDYEKFIRIYPWYEFPFAGRFKNIWNDCSFQGRNNIRKWERKLFLSCEFGGKSVYAWLIKLGTKSVYGDAEEEVFACVETSDEKQITGIPELKIKEKLADSLFLVSLPRYEKFNKAIYQFTDSKAEFENISGNKLILATLVVPSKNEYKFKNCEVLFNFPVLTDTSLKRLGVEIPVTRLTESIREFKSAGLATEHIYDY